MKKIYSFVLMAAMLLVGTSVKAAVDGIATDAEDLQAEIDALRGTSGTVTLDDDIVLTDPIWIGPADGSVNGAAPSVILDLAGHKITETAANSTDSIFMFVLGKGTLHVKNGKIMQLQTAAAASNMFSVYGTYDKTANYTNLIIENGVQLSATSGTIIAILEKAIQTSTTASDKDHYKGAYGKVFPNQLTAGFVTNYENASRGFAFGVNVEVDGKLTVGGSTDKTYGIKINGLIGYPQGTNRRSISSLKAYEAWLADAPAILDASYNDYVPYVHVGPNAEITSSNTIHKSAAIYASGYGKWLIEGKCDGNIGVSISSGEVEINDAEIHSSANDFAMPQPGNSVSGAGSAIVINSRTDYPGEVQVTISGNTQATADAGYAILEKINTNDGNTKVEKVTIESGSFSGGNNTQINGGVIYVENKTLQDGAIKVETASLDGNVQVSGAIATETQINTIVQTGSGAHYEQDPNDPTKSIIVISPATYTVTLNGSGLATFSAATAVKVDNGLTVYTAEFDGFNNYLILTEQHNIDSIPANTGVILYGTADHQYTLTAPATNANSNVAALTGTNHLEPASAWGQKVAKENVYILSGSEMYKYVGSDMKDNKAYLDLNGIITSAPQRIRMVIAQEEQTEAIESAEAASVKAVKFMENGEIFIRRGENVYNLQGQIVK